MATEVRKAAVGDAAVGVLIPIGRDAAWTVIFSPAGAHFTIWSPTCIALRSDAHAIADRDAWSGVGADSDSGADDFVAGADGVERLALDGVGLLDGSSVMDLWE